LEFAFRAGGLCIRRTQAYRGRFLGKPLPAILRFRHQDAQPPSSPRVGEGGRGDAHRGRFFGKPLPAILRFSHQDAQPPPSPRVGEGGREDAHRGRFFGKPLRAISRFSHQDAQPPSSPRVGEGGRGDEGQKARECSKPRIAPKNATLESARRGAGGLAEGLWPLSNYSALARAGGLCIP